MDFLTKKTKVNEGEVSQYYVQNNHSAIIKPEVFDMVQQKIRVYKWVQEREQLQEEMNVVSELIHQCIRENTRVAQDQGEYQKKYDALVRRYDTAKDRLDEADSIINQKQARKAEIELFLSELDKLGIFCVCECRRQNSL